MKILITGGAGYIGSYLALYLKENPPHDITILCRKLPDHFKHWHDHFRIIESDITNYDHMAASIPIDIDIIIHLAAYNDIDTMKDPSRALLVNATGTRNILEFARQNNSLPVVYFSTLQVYGKELSGHYTIDTPLKSDDDYALTHIAAEEYCKMFASRYGMDVTILRPANIFGCPVDHNIDRCDCACASCF